MFNKKSEKKGFTLAELLLVLGIIGIVSAMGMAVAKKTTDSAYKKYFYTGYINLYDAIGDIEMTKKPHSTTDAFKQSLKDIFKESKNGITYNVVRKVGKYFVIDMAVPQPKTRSNPDAIAHTRFLYAPDNGSAYLVPLAQDQMPAGYISLQDRQDLLQAYVDTGLTGRAVQGKIGGNEGKKIRATSFKGAYCSCNDSYGVNGVTSGDLTASLPKKFIDEVALMFKHIYAIRDTERAIDDGPNKGDEGHGGGSGGKTCPEEHYFYNGSCVYCSGTVNKKGQCDCGPDKAPDPVTGECKFNCTGDTILDPESGGCISKFKLCAKGTGTSWNPKTKSCGCENEGWIYNPATNTCTAPEEPEEPDEPDEPDEPEGPVSYLTIIDCTGFTNNSTGILKFRMP